MSSITPLNYVPSSSTRLPRLFLYEPSSSLRRIEIYSTTDDGNPKLKGIIYRKTIVIVIESIHSEKHMVKIDNFIGIIRVKLSNLREIDQIHRYLLWAGNNYFFHIPCIGLIMFGSDAKFFLFTNGLILAPAIMFFILLFQRMNEDFLSFTGRRTVAIIMSILLCQSIVYLWITATTDPGIITRNPYFMEVRKAYESLIIRLFT